MRASGQISYSTLLSSWVGKIMTSLTKRIYTQSELILGVRGPRSKFMVSEDGVMQFISIPDRAVPGLRDNARWCDREKRCEPYLNQRDDFLQLCRSKLVDHDNTFLEYGARDEKPLTIS